VAFIIGGLVAIPVMITEVVPAGVRGIAFSVTGFLGAVASAISPTLIGFVADQFESWWTARCAATWPTPSSS